MAEEELKVKLSLDDTEFRRGLQKAFSSMGNFGEALQGFGKDMTKFVTLPMLAAAGIAVKWAADEEEADARIAASLKNVGKSWKALEGPIRSYITAAEAATGFNDTDLQNSLSGLIQTTGDYGRAMSLLPLAADLARAKQMDLATAASLVGKVAQGNVAMLARYGIVLKEGATATEALAALQQKFGGSSSAFMQTLSGHTADLSNQFQNMAETIGKALLPLALKLVDGLTWLVRVGQGLAAMFAALPDRTRGIIVAVLALVAAIGPLSIAIGSILVVLPMLKVGFLALTTAILPLILKLALLAGLAAFLAANWETGVNIIKASFYGLALVVLKAVQAMVGNILRLASVIPGLKDVAGKARTALEGMTDSMELGFMDAAAGVEKNSKGIGGTWDWLKDKAKALQDTLGGFATAPVVPPLPSSGPALDAEAAAWQAWAAKQKATIFDLATTLNQQFNQMATDMVVALATGTKSAGDVLFDFLQRSLESVASYVITNMGLFQWLAKAIVATLGNPWIALGVIAAGMAAVAALKSSFKPMATGGIVTGPTQALVGEAGPEAVIPLSSGRAGRFLDGLGGGGGDQTIYVMLDGRTIAENTARHLPGVLKLQGSFR